MSYQFANILFNTRAQAIEAAVGEFLTAGGWNGPEDIREAQADPAAAADEMIDGWGQIELTGAWRDELSGEWSHEPEFATRDELIDAIRNYPRPLTDAEIRDSLYTPSCAGEVDPSGKIIRLGSSLLHAGGRDDGTWFESADEALEFFHDLADDDDPRALVSVTE